MSKKELQPTSKSAMQQLAARLSVSTAVLQDTLKATAFKSCKTNEQFIAAIMVANTYKLNPILKEMTVFPSKDGGVVPIVMVDGFISMVNRQPEFDGVELIENEDEGAMAGIGSVTAKFYLKNRTHPVVVTEYMAECYDGNKGPWKKWPRRMLRHKAYIQGARIAFGFSGVYDPDEGDRIIEAEGKVVGKPEVKEPKALTEAPPEASKPEEQPKQNAYKEMLEQFQEAKGMLGDTVYYKILKNRGYTKSNEIKNVALGQTILDEMMGGGQEQVS